MSNKGINVTRTIAPSDLVPMDLFSGDFPLIINIAYKTAVPPNIFGVIYRHDARLWLHRDLAKIVLLASKMIHQDHGYSCVLYDGLRTTEAQSLMANSDIARANTHWLEEPGRLLSPPGAGAHPRAMAIDMSLQAPDGANLDMGTAFDHLAENPAARHNPAHRDYPKLGEAAQTNRTILTGSMVKAADTLETPLLPLPQEWWDFRLPAGIYEEYAPLSDASLSPQMRMTDIQTSNDIQDLPEEHFETLRQTLLQELNQHYR